ncbi:MAG: ribulose 1,5-bisphosphate carboxylase large subunit, partial [Phycisphaerae bacterium]|nr:ribulose 1,5-bisphosphate carboxylase large subunit [Phycisphaerae bacterium]
MKTIDVTYDLTCAAAEAEHFAHGIALEQTVEVPEDVAQAANLPPGAIGEVAAVEPLSAAPERFRAVIRYAVELSAFQLPQLLNLVYGNIS